MWETMRTKRLYINTMGCQMNVYDSDQIRNRLASLGYVPVDAPEGADLIIVNTCAIRDKAEQKAFSFLGRLAPLKTVKPDLIIGIGGCVAQQEGRKILSRMPYVDLVFGTHAIARLPRTIERISATRCRVVDVALSEGVEAEDFVSGPLVTSDVSAFVTIMRGCDNYCTYCVVPYVRGRESSRAPDAILDEIRHLVNHGVREVTLLGQNVNSYGLKEGLPGFDQLLEQVNRVEGLARIRFTTSHPKDLSGALMHAFGHLEKLCPHIHLPVQSGSDVVLKRMNRRYSSGQYLEKVARLRQIRPEMAITSDIIVGFPGESEQDFAATLELIRQVRFDSLFAFIYSDRPNAPAVRFDGKIAEAVKKERLQRVLAFQERITAQKHQAMIGDVHLVLVDGPSKHPSSTADSPPSDGQSEPGQWAGRTGGNKIVHFAGEGQAGAPNQILTGRMMPIMIERAMAHSLWGRPVPDPRASAVEGEPLCCIKPAWPV